MEVRPLLLYLRLPLLKVLCTAAKIEILCC